MPWLFGVDRSDADEQQREPQGHHECDTHDDECIEGPDATADEDATPRTELTGRGP